MIICRGFGEDFKADIFSRRKTVEVSRFDGDKLWTLIFIYSGTENKIKVYTFDHKE